MTPLLSWTIPICTQERSFLDLNATLFYREAQGTEFRFHEIFQESRRDLRGMFFGDIPCLNRRKQNAGLVLLRSFISELWNQLKEHGLTTKAPSPYGNLYGKVVHNGEAKGNFPQVRI